MGRSFAAGGQEGDRGVPAGRNGRGGPNAGMRGRREARPPGWGLVRLLYTSNPFYILSADLVFAGLRMSFGRGGPAGGTWALAGSLAGYTLLLATTACLLIRLGRLWDDLRTLLLVIVIMFLAIAMSGDDLLAADHARGALGCAVGLAFAAGVSEVVLHVIRLRLPGWYRGAYHAMLALLFLYPVAMVPLLGDPDNPALQWALFAFGLAAALAVMLLVPAARGGSAALDKNGSPWRWPLYPWSLFVVLAGALCVRAWSLCVSFHYVPKSIGFEGSRSIFGPYFLVPIGLAAALVWLEIGLTARSPRATAGACVMPLVLVLLAAVGHREEPVYAGFLARFMETFGGSPVYLTALAAIAFLALAGFRGVRAGIDLLPAGLIVLALVGPRTIGPGSVTSPRAVPMVLAAIVLGAMAWRRGDSRRAILAVACLAVASLRAAIDLGAGPMAWPIAAHLGIAGLMAVGVLFDDPVARVARYSAAVALGLLGLFASDDGKGMWRSMPAGLMSWYAPVIAVAAAGFGLLVRDRWYLAAAAAGLAGWLARSGAHSYARLREAVVGLDFVVFGLLFFAMAAAISLRKAGLWPRGGSRGYNPLLAAEPRDVETSPANHPGG